MSTIEAEVPSDVTMREPLVKLAKDVFDATAELSQDDARWLVGMYYLLQQDRTRAAHQARTIGNNAEPNRLVVWLFGSMKRFEDVMKSILGTFSDRYSVGLWFKSNYGLGPVIASAFLAHFDIRKAPTAGHFWRFAGIDPSLKWLGREGGRKLLAELEVTDNGIDEGQIAAIHEASGHHVKRIREVYEFGFKAQKGPLRKKSKGLAAFLAIRPWNADLKAIAVFRMGETLVKFSGKEECFYGRLWRQKKDELWADNLRGKFIATATEEAPRYKKTTEAYQWKIGEYSPQRVKAWLSRVAEITEANRGLPAKEKATLPKLDDVPELHPDNLQPMLPPGHIHNRARRWIAHLVISHLHEVMYWDFHHKAPPAPFVFAYPGVCGEHGHMIKPPNFDPSIWPKPFEGRPLSKLYQ